MLETLPAALLLEMFLGPPQVGPARKKRKKKVEPKRKRRKNHTIRVGVDLLYIPPKGMYMSIYPLKIV